MRIRERLFAAVMAFLLCCGVAGGVAQGKTLVTDNSKLSNASHLYLHEEQFSSEHGENDLFSGFSESFNTGDWSISGASVTIYYTATQIVDKNLSSITLSINGQSFYSQRPEPSNDGTIYTIEVGIPISSIKTGQNTLSVDTYIRTLESLPCVDDVSAANWIVFSKDSFVSVSYLPKALCNNIAEFCEQFVSIDALENKQSAVYVRPDADSTELTAAGLALAGLSGQAKMYYDNISLEAADEDKLSERDYKLYICEYASLPDKLKNMLSQEEQDNAAKDAQISLIKAYGGKLLLVTGTDEEAIKNAARLLGNAAYIAQMQKRTRTVTASENVLTPQSAIEQYVKLTESGTEVHGLFSQSAYFYIQNPDNRRLTDASQLCLEMRYAENLDFDRSLVTVYVNDVPIGSKKLEKENAQGDSLTLNFPSDLQVSGNFTLRVTFNLERDDAWCTLRQFDSPWAWVSNESTLKLTTEEVTSLIFENYPTPFVEDGSLNNVVMLLPEIPDASDLTAMGSIILTLGRSLEDNTGALTVAKGSASVQNISASNVISIGSYENNPAAQSYNDKLFFRFSEDGKTLESNEKMLIDPDYGSTLGTVQLLDSPYGSGKALLLVSGASDEAMLRGAKYLSSSELVWKIYGDGLVADEEQVFCYRFKEDNADAQTVSTVKQLTSRKDLIGIEMTGFVVILIAIITGGLLWRKYRIKWRGNKK